MQSLPPDVERRCRPRFDVLVQVRVHHDDTDLVLEVKNLSISGALVDLAQIERPGWLLLGARVELTFVIPDSVKSVDLVGQVVRLTEDLRYRHFAVQFQDVAPQEERALARLIDAGRKRVGPPPLPDSPKA